MCTWTRQPQERAGTYMFAGKLYVTRGIDTELPLEEILFIYWDVKAFAEHHGGADYLQVYIDGLGRKIFAIAQLSEEQLESNNYTNADNYCTLMFAHEY